MKKPNITEDRWVHHSDDITDENDNTIAVCHSSKKYRIDAQAISAVPEMINALILAYKDYKNEGAESSIEYEQALIKALKKAGVEL